MTPCQRSPAPQLLADHGASIGKEYAERKAQEPSYRFQWPKRDGKSLGEVARQALKEMTRDHCSYCDGYPLGSMDKSEVDHFRPKGEPRFYALVCQWENLFLACTACNSHKGERWDEALLAPDAGSYQFERYFEYHADTGELHPSAGAAEVDRERARRTIEILGLNRAATCEARRREVRVLAVLREEPDDRPYRFLAPMVLRRAP